MKRNKRLEQRRKRITQDTKDLVSSEFEKINKNYFCPECGSSNVFDFEIKIECEECGFAWSVK